MIEVLSRHKKAFLRLNMANTFTLTHKDNFGIHTNKHLDHVYKHLSNGIHTNKHLDHGGHYNVFGKICQPYNT